MAASQINRTTDLAALLPALARHGRYFTGPCPFCGGDRGLVRALLPLRTHGKTYRAKIVDPVFYDKEGAKQNV